MRNHGTVLKLPTAARQITSDASPSDMLHSIVMVDNQKRPYQILFSGDRVMVHYKICDEIGKKLVVDERFSGFVATLDTYTRYHPLHDNQGCETYFDKSLLQKEEVHVQTRDGLGYWANPQDLMGAFKNAHVIDCSVDGAVGGFDIGMDFVTTKNSFQNESLLENHIYGLNDAIGSLVFHTSAEELVAIGATNDGFQYDDLCALLEIDVVLFSELFSFYHSTAESPSESASIEDVVSELGVSTVLCFLNGLAASKNTFFAEHIGINGQVTFVAQWAMAFLMKRVTELAASKHSYVCPKTAGNIGRLAFSQFYTWVSVAGEENYRNYISALQLNPHRFAIEMQEMVVGFNQQDVARYMMNVNDFPPVYSEALSNFHTPFFNGDNCYYANLMYVLAATMVDEGIIPACMFYCMHNVHQSLKIEMGLSIEISQALSELKQAVKAIECQKWRFGKPALSGRQKIDPELFIYRA